MPPSPAFSVLARYLVARRRRDLLAPLAEAYASLLVLLALVARAKAADATQFKVEAMVARRAFERAVSRVEEEIADAEDGAGLLAMLLGDDELLADKLLGE